MLEPDDRRERISRIESGRTIPTVADVERMLKGLAPIPSAVADQVLSLARVANVEHASWRSVARSGLWRKQDEIKALTESSETVRHFLPIVPSGLLQTPEYARCALTPVIEGNPARDIDRAVQARLDSQDALNDESRRFFFVLTEQAVKLKRAPAPTMAGQLRHMAKVAGRPNVELGIVPGSVLVEASPLNVFVAYDDRLVIVELFSGEVALRDYRDVLYHSMCLNTFAVELSLVWLLRPSSKRSPTSLCGRATKDGNTVRHDRCSVLWKSKLSGRMSCALSSVRRERA
jgi:hypothetical protein